MRNTLFKSIAGVTLTLILSTMFLTQKGLSAQHFQGGRYGQVWQPIVGTWIAQVANSTGTIALFEVGNFSPDGSYTGANVDGLHSPHKGVWQPIGPGQYLLTVLFFTHDAQGTFNGIVKARILLTVAADGNSYDSVAERTVMDKFGNVLSVTPGIVGHSVRMNVELPQ